MMNHWGEKQLKKNIGCDAKGAVQQKKMFGRL